MEIKLLQHQVALVTGASSGIGQAAAIGLGRAGAKVVVNYHSDAAGAEHTVRAVQAAGSEALAVQADVSQEQEVEALFAKAVERFGGLDILVANAGMQQHAAIAEMTLGQWQKVLSVNLDGAFLCARQAVRQFRRQGRGDGSKALGKILFVSSVHDTIPWAEQVNYAASKGGMKLLMQSLAQEVAHEGIRVNAVAPGAIKTDINRASWESKDAEQKLLRLIPYGRVGEPEDIANSVVWLASDLADYVVGTTLYVDGGMLLYPSFGNG